MKVYRFGLNGHTSSHYHLWDRVKISGGGQRTFSFYLILFDFAFFPMRMLSHIASKIKNK